MSSPTYPGVYIGEIPGDVHTITGVATSITAFVGRALRGPVNQPVRVQGFPEFSRVLGGLWTESPMSYAVSQFFQHGGTDALIVRVFNGDVSDSTATLTLGTASGNFVLEASSPGVWGRKLRVTVDHQTDDTSDLLLFNLTVQELKTPGGTEIVTTESFRNMSVAPGSERFVDSVLREESTLVQVRSSAPDDESPTDGMVTAAGGDSDDGGEITDAEIQGDQGQRTGIHALDSADLFNLLCIPPLTRETEVGGSTWAAAAGYCRDRRAVLIIDPRASWTAKPATAISSAKAGVNTLRETDVGNAAAINAAAYFPRLRMPDLLDENRLADFAPCGAVAGIIARTDAQHGVWRAPAGVNVTFFGVQGLTYTMTDAENGLLNPVGLNCLRTFLGSRHVVWGARTLAGADLLASEWRYLPVRRLALFIEESLFRGTQWVVLEPNGEPLWVKIRASVGAFLHELFRQGAFQGSKPSDAYFVKCDGETTTQNDIDLGIVNILVGFAPRRPAEFVVIRIQQLTGGDEG